MHSPFELPPRLAGTRSLFATFLASLRETLAPTFPDVNQQDGHGDPADAEGARR